MNRLQSTFRATWLPMALLVGLRNPVWSQQPTQPVADVLAMTAQQFEIWVGDETEKSYKIQKGATPSMPYPKPLKPPAVDAALVRRLRADKAVTDLTVRSVISLWHSYEQRMSLHLTPPKPNTKPFAKAKETTKLVYSYLQTRRLVETLIPLLYGRPLLQAELQNEKARLLDMEGDKVSAVKEYEKAISLLAPSSHTADHAHIDSLIRLADARLELNDKKGALALYAKALHYSGQHLLSEQQGYEDTGYSYYNGYVSAGMGTINVFKGDLKALQGLKFIGWTLQSLGYPLAKAIEEAGGPSAPSILEMESGGPFWPGRAETPTEPIPMAEPPPPGTGPEKKKP